MKKWYVTISSPSGVVTLFLQKLTDAGVEPVNIKIDGDTIYYYHDQEIQIEI